MTDKDHFFAKYNITDFEELEELPWRFRDASIHYYHRKNDAVYTQYICSSLRGKWYITSFAKELHFRYTNPEGYQREQEQAVIAIEIEQKAFAEYNSQFDTAKKVLERYTNDGVIQIDQSFINDIIKNKLYGIIFGDINGPVKDARYCDFNNVLDTIELPYLDADSIYDAGDSACLSRMFSLIWDCQAVDGQDLYISMNGAEATRLHPDAIIPITHANYTDIRFTNKDGNPMHNIKYRGLYVNVGSGREIHAVLTRKNLLCCNGPGFIGGMNGMLYTKS